MRFRSHFIWRRTPRWRAALLALRTTTKSKCTGTIKVEPHLHQFGRTPQQFHHRWQQDGAKRHAAHESRGARETIEITHGFTDWFETGFYIFTYQRNSNGFQWVGDHIRPRFRVPKKWNWPVGLSLSNEIGYQRRKFSTDTWTWEIRPIIDKQVGRWYLSCQSRASTQVTFMAIPAIRASPSRRISNSVHDLTKKITGGFEYYGAKNRPRLHGFSPDRAATTPDLSDDRPERFSEVGGQFRPGGRRHTLDGPLDRQGDSRVPFQFLSVLRE